MLSAVGWFGVAVTVAFAGIVGPEMAHAVDTHTVTALPGPVVAHRVVLALATVLSVVKPPPPHPPFAR